MSCTNLATLNPYDLEKAGHEIAHLVSEKNEKINEKE